MENYIIGELDKVRLKAGGSCYIPVQEFIEFKIEIYKEERERIDKIIEEALFAFNDSSETAETDDELAILLFGKSQKDFEIDCDKMQNKFKRDMLADHIRSVRELIKNGEGIYVHEGYINLADLLKYQLDKYEESMQWFLERENYTQEDWNEAFKKEGN